MKVAKMFQPAWAAIEIVIRVFCSSSSSSSALIAVTVWSNKVKVMQVRACVQAPVTMKVVVYRWLDCQVTWQITWHTTRRMTQLLKQWKNSCYGASNHLMTSHFKYCHSIARARIYTSIHLSDRKISMASPSGTRHWCSVRRPLAALKYMSWGWSVGAIISFDV